MYVQYTPQTMYSIPQIPKLSASAIFGHPSDRSHGIYIRFVQQGDQLRKFLLDLQLMRQLTTKLGNIEYVSSPPFRFIVEIKLVNREQPRLAYTLTIRQGSELLFQECPYVTLT